MSSGLPPGGKSLPLSFLFILTIATTGFSRFPFQRTFLLSFRTLLSFPTVPEVAAPFLAPQPFLGQALLEGEALHTSHAKSGQLSAQSPFAVSGTFLPPFSSLPRRRTTPHPIPPVDRVSPHSPASPSSISHFQGRRPPHVWRGFSGSHFAEAIPW